MTKFRTLLISFVAVICAVCAVVFAGCGYTPETGKKYYKVNDICRVIELDDSKTHTIEDCGLNPFMTSFEGTALTPVSVKFSYYLYKNSLFFKETNILNKDGVLCVYDCIGIEKHSDIVDEGLYTGSYTTFNAVCETEQVHSFSAWDKPRGVVYGFISDVVEYTFNYVDYDKRGNEGKSGSFTVLLCMETPRTGFFELK